MATVVTVTSAVQLRHHPDPNDATVADRRKVFTPGQYVDEAEWILPDGYRRVIADSTWAGPEEDSDQPLPPPPAPAVTQEVEVLPSQGASAFGALQLDVASATITEIEEIINALPEDRRTEAARWAAQEEAGRGDDARPMLLKILNAYLEG